MSYVERMNSHDLAPRRVARYLRTLDTHSRFPALAALRGMPGAGRSAATKDMITPVAHSEEIVRAAAARRAVVMPDSGHVVMLEHADEVNAALVAFLEKICLTWRPREPSSCRRSRTPTAFGRRLAGVLRAGDLVCSTGPLGAGKTALAQGIGAGLRRARRRHLADLRDRPGAPAGPGRGGRCRWCTSTRTGWATPDPRAEIDDLDLDAVDESVTVVEWGEGMVEQLADAHLRVRIDRRDDDTRTVSLHRTGGDWARRLADLEVGVPR